MARIQEWLREYWLVGVIALAALGFWWWQGRAGAQDLAPVAAPASSVSSSVASSSATSSAVTSSTPKAGFVHIKGAVAHPGLYPVDGTTRWDAVVKAAGGLTADADVTSVNLAAIAGDQESLLIPKVGEAAPPPTAAGATGAASAAAGSTALIDLNTATEAELQTLSGIGPAKAADIIAYRDSNGGFKAVEELKEVSGIGDKTYERLAPFVTVGP